MSAVGQVWSITRNAFADCPACTARRYHEENAPETWQVVKTGDRHWWIMTTEGHQVGRFATKRAALLAADIGWAAQQWHERERWYRGEKQPRCVDYVPCHAYAVETVG
jgi:hypothetical protein